MRTALLGFLLALGAGAQTITFTRQDFTRIPGLTEYRAAVAFPKGAPLEPLPAMAVILEGVHQSIRVYFPVNLQSYVNRYNQRSWARWVGIGAEAVGWGTTFGNAVDVLKVKEKWIKAGVAGVSSALTLGRSIYDREYKPLAIPADAMPMKVAGSPGEVVDFAVWTAP